MTGPRPNHLEERVPKVGFSSLFSERLVVTLCIGTVLGTGEWCDRKKIPCVPWNGDEDTLRWLKSPGLESSCVGARAKGPVMILCHNRGKCNDSSK